MTAILFTTEQGDNAIPHYRARVPGRVLQGLGWTVWHRRILAQRPDRRLFGWDGPGNHPTPVPKVVVARHMVDPTQGEADCVAMYREARDRGQFVFVDLDDDVWQLPAWNPAAAFYTPAMLERVNANLDASSGVFVSTPALAEQTAKHTSAPVFVCPNAIDTYGYHVTDEHDPIRVGWCGMTDWRIGDLAMIADELADALRGRRVEFWQIGAQSGRFPISDALGPDFPVPVVERPWVPMSELPGALADIDLAVVPMEDIPINRSRSATTGLALAASGIPIVASPLPAYEELADRGGCALAGDGQWADMLVPLIRSAALRDEARTLALNAVARWYNPTRVCRAWQESIRSVMGGR